MKIMLIQSFLGRFEPEGAIFPLGLSYIASMLQGHDVQIFDPNISQSPYYELEEKIKAFKPQIVGISLRNIDTTQRKDIFYYFKTLQPTTHLLKSIDHYVKIIIGGTGFSMFASKIMERIPEIDFGVYLEGDESFPELLRKLDKPEDVKGIFVRKDGRVIFTGVRPFPDVGKLPLPNRALLEIKKYDRHSYTNIAIQTKRGCPLKCAYCSYPFINGKKTRARSSKQVVDEIEDLINEFDIRRFMFADSVFNLPESHAENICKEIVRRQLQVQWSAWFNIQRFSKELLTLAIKAGCKNFSFSPDAITNASLKALRKDISEQDISRIIKMFKRTSKVRIEFNLFCTPPKQDFFGFLKTLFFFIKINILFFGRSAVRFGWIRIEPDTRIYEMAVNERIISKETELLPLKESEFPGLFYSCASTRRYADPIFGFIIYIEKGLKIIAKRIFRRNIKYHS